MDNLAAYSIPALVQAAANGYGDKICAMAPERTVTFRQFAADVTAIAKHLETLGIAPGERVAILDVNSLNFLESLCALGVLGAIAVPLNYRQRVPEYRFQIEDSGARLLLVNSRYRAEAEELAPSLELGWRTIDDPVQIGLPATAGGKVGGRPIRLSDLDPATPLAICYTSGTTGRPKGAEPIHLWFDDGPQISRQIGGNAALQAPIDGVEIHPRAVWRDPIRALR